MKIEVPDDMSTCGSAELRALIQLCDGTASEARRALGQRSDQVAMAPPTNVVTDRINWWIDHRPSAHVSWRVVVVGLALVALLNFSMLASGVRSFVQHFEAAKAELKESRKP